MAPRRSNKKDGKGKESELPLESGLTVSAPITTSYVLFLRVCFRRKILLIGTLLFAKLFPWRM
jgi:hypothetical protein